MNRREPYKNSVVDKRLVKEKKRRKKVGFGQLSKHALSEMETREEIMISPSIRLFSRGKGEKRTSRKGLIYKVAQKFALSEVSSLQFA